MHLSEKHKIAIGTAMRRAHKEGRAWNIGKSRWNNKPSAAEKMFMRFLKNNNFKERQDYYREFPFSIYSADFYFPKLALVIEIDGVQHERFEEYKRRDERKEKVIRDFDIEILRIKWQAVCRDSKKQFESILAILNKRENREMSIKAFSDKQLTILNLMTEREKLKKEENERKLKLKLEQKERLRLERAKDLSTIAFKLGVITKLCRKWQVSHTEVRRYIRKYFKEYDIELKRSSLK